MPRLWREVFKLQELMANLSATSGKDLVPLFYPRAFGCKHISTFGFAEPLFDELNPIHWNLPLCIHDGFHRTCEDVWYMCIRFWYGPRYPATHRRLRATHHRMDWPFESKMGENTNGSISYRWAFGCHLEESLYQAAFCLCPTRCPAAFATFSIAVLAFFVICRNCRLF